MNRKLVFGLLFGGGATVLTAVLMRRKAVEIEDAISDAVDSPPVPLPLAPSDRSKLRSFKAHLTGYWPYAATEGERKMEGGKKDRMGRPIITLEMHQSDPVKYPYVSVAGDWTIWPDGQRVILSPWPNAVFRIVDTGSHFFGAKKVYRVIDEEPLDIAVNSSKTTVPKKDVIMSVVPGDTFGSKKGPKVAQTGKLPSQSIVLGFDHAARMWRI